MQRSCLSALLIGALATAVLSSPQLTAQVEERDGSFGFAGKHIFKFHRGVGPVAIADLDRDQRQDIVVVDSYRGELVILYQDPESRGKRHGTGPNDLTDPEGFRRLAVPITRKVDAMLVEDLDGDGWQDLLLVGSGAVEVRWGSEAQGFEGQDRFRLADAVAGSTVIAHDRSDAGLEVFFLARKGVHRFRGFSRERSPEREFFPGSAGSPNALFLTDLDGDGRRDLLTVLDDAEHPFRLRLRRADGAFGAETVLAGERPAAVRTVATRHGDAIVSLALGKGRFDILGLELTQESDPFDLPPPEVFPLHAAGLENPRLLVADLDGDGDVDVAVTHRSESAVLLFLNEGGVLVAATPSPTLRKVVSLQAGDLDGDGRPEILVTSADEQVAGASPVENGALRFPKVLEGISSPIVAAPGRFGAGGAEIAAVTKTASGLELAVYRRGEAGPWVASDLKVAAADLGGEPQDILVADLDGDGSDEILLFVPYQTPKLFRLVDGALVAVPAPGVLEKATRGGVAIGAGGDLLVASGNHCRRVRLVDGKPEVAYQVNGVSASSNIVCAVEVRLESDREPYLALVDRTDRTLAIFGGDAPQPELLRSIAGPFDRVQQGVATDLDGDGRDEILLLDPRFLAVIRTDGRRLELRSRFTYQHPDETTRYVTATSGDLNGDGETDLVLSNGPLRGLQLLRPGPGASWIHALRFPVYEAKSFMGRGSGPMEPRWVGAGDLDGDGRSDLLIMVHDRLILYPQDPAI